MINFQLNKKVTAAFVAVLMFGSFSVASSAALIDAASELAVFGVYTPDNADLTQATELAFSTPATIAAGVNDFAFAVGGSATFNSIVFDPATPGPVLTFASGGAFNATSISVDTQSGSALDLTMLGFWSLDGFDDTYGQLVLTADSLGGLFTFSASGTIVPAPIPVPAALLLFGSALAGLGVTGRRKK